MSSVNARKVFTPTTALRVVKGGHNVGELRWQEGAGLYFTYARDWLAHGFNLSPLTMKFDDAPQLASDNVFRGLHGPFADSLPDGWGLLLMDKFFNSTFGVGTSLTLTPLDRLAYLGDRGMGALEYQPQSETVDLSGEISLAQLYEASVQVQTGQTEQVLQDLRLAGGSPGGARPKAIVALSADCAHGTSAFEPLAPGFEHWIIKFRALDESPETGAIEHAYAQMARDAGVNMAVSRLIDVPLAKGGMERVFATRRFDREGDAKVHMMTVAALTYADFRMPSIDYSDMLKLTQMLTGRAGEVEKMARLMVFNALAHNYDDHSKNFAFLRSGDGWVMAPAYDVTFSEGMGEHSTSFAGKGKPTRALLRELCKEYRYLKVDDYIDQTLETLAGWEAVFHGLEIDLAEGRGIFTVLDGIRAKF
ncbi:type II toxin-antitoxin system HipA family toxin [Pseudomonas sp. TE3610]